jgi:hypothetical protein
MQETFKKLLIVLFLLLGLVYTILMSSCRTSGYGCDGKSSWGQTLKRANKMY